VLYGGKQLEKHAGITQRQRLYWVKIGLLTAHASSKLYKPRYTRWSMLEAALITRLHKETMLSIQEAPSFLSHFRSAFKRLCPIDDSQVINCTMVFLTLCKAKSFNKEHNNADRWYSFLLVNGRVESVGLTNVHKVNVIHMEDLWPT